MFPTLRLPIQRSYTWLVAIAVTIFVIAGLRPAPIEAQQAPFTRRILATTPEAPFDLRFFSGPVKTDSRGRIITGQTSDPVKRIVGAEAAGERAGLARFTRILFGCNYFTGRPSPSDRINPNAPQVTSGSQHWPHIEQPFRSWPNAVAVTPDGRKLYVTLPGRDAYPDWRIAVVDIGARRVLRWVDLRPAGQTRGTRPTGVAIAPSNPTIFSGTYAVVVNEFANFASVLDTANDTVIGEFPTGFYSQDLLFNETGTRLYVTDRLKDSVKVFVVDPGPSFRKIADIRTGFTDLDRTNPRDLSLSADGRTLYAANTLGHTITAVNVEGDANVVVAILPVGGLCTDIKIAGRWGIVCGQSTNNVLNDREVGNRSGGQAA